jgi:hypothetical protein
MNNLLFLLLLFWLAVFWLLLFAAQRALSALLAQTKRRLDAPSLDFLSARSVQPAAAVIIREK